MHKNNVVAVKFQKKKINLFFKENKFFNHNKSQCNNDF